jgi:hypothetical protein
MKKLLPHGIVIKCPRTTFKNVYELNLDHPVVNSLLRAYGISMILASEPANIVRKLDDELISLALIGDFMTENWNEESEIEFVAVTESTLEVYDRIVPQLEDRMGREVVIQQFNLDKWELMIRKESDSFVRKCEENFTLFGDPLFYGQY